MSTSTAVETPEARYVSVDQQEYVPARGSSNTVRKHLITTERLQIHQSLTRGRGATLEVDFSAATRVAYVLAGAAVLQHSATDQRATQVGKGHLIIIAPGTHPAHAAEQLTLLTDELVLLEVARATTGQSPVTSSSAVRLRAVDPASVEAYAPAGHANTQNRCLFVDEHMEIIEGLIERGGGAERHCHPHHEQLLYVLAGAGDPLLIHYPKGAPHGTGGGVPERLELLVIYSPPLGESHNALA